MRPAKPPAPTRPRPPARIRHNLLAVASALALAGTTFAVSITAQAAAPPTPAGWTPTFVDDFNGNALGGAWRHSEGTFYPPNGPANFGTGEVEVNSRNNATVANGVLSVTARGQGTGGWTSDRIETNRQDFQPPAGGKLRVEARLRLPEAPNGQSNGYWPAFWMLAGDYRGNLWNWPMVGEIDIMESISGINRTWQTMHCGWLDPAQGPNVCNEKNGIGNGGAGPCGQGPLACTKSFHTYTIDWSRAGQSVTWYVDGRQVWRTQRGGNIRADAWDMGFNHGFFIVLNLAIGGEMPANNGVPLNGATAGGGHLDADYVAVHTGGANAPPPGVPVDPSQPPPPPACATNFALGRPATASSQEAANLAPQFAVDGNPGTRWSSAFADNQWLQVDLGAAKPITSATLNWEAAYSSSYQIQTSDGPNGPWTTRYTQTFGSGGVERVPVTATARYVRMNGQTRGTPYGHSLWEFEVCGGTGGTPSPGPSTSSPPPTGSTSWAPGVAYGIGQTVTYNGVKYQCRQAHTSQVTWEPPNAPALWLQI